MRRERKNMLDLASIEPLSLCSQARHSEVLQMPVHCIAFCSGSTSDWPELGPRSGATPHSVRVSITEYGEEAGTGGVGTTAARAALASSLFGASSR